MEVWRELSLTGAMFHYTLGKTIQLMAKTEIRGLVRVIVWELILVQSSMMSTTKALSPSRITQVLSLSRSFPLPSFLPLSLIHNKIDML